MKLRLSGVLIAALAACIVLAACSRDEPPAAPAAVASDPPAAAPAAPDCHLTMGWDAWEPYHFEGEDGQLRGIEIELVQAIASHAGCTLSFQRGDWAGNLRALARGEIDLLGSATLTPEREAYAVFSAPYRDESFRLFVRAGTISDPPETTLTDWLAVPNRLGLTQGYYYGEDINALQDDPAFADRLVELPHGDAGFDALLAGEVDGVLEDPYVATAVLRRRGLREDVQMHPMDLGSSSVRLMFSRVSVDPSVVQRFGASLEALQASGEIDALIARYRMQ